MNRPLRTSEPVPSPECLSGETRAGQVNNRTARRWETLQVSLVLLALLVVFFWRPLLTGRKLLPVDIAFTDPLYGGHAPTDWVKPYNILLYDQTYQFYPWRVYVSQALRQGYLPFWNPDVYCGVPLLAEDQPAVFYPLNILSYAFSPADAVLFTAVARLFIAGLAMYWLVRTLGAGRWGALIGAVTFAFSGFMIVFLGHPHTNVVACLPAYFLTIEWLYRRNNAQHVAFVALVIAAQLTGGHSETALYTLFAGGLYYLYLVWTDWSRNHRWRPVAWAMLSFGAAAILGLALAAVHVFPFLQWLQQSAELRLRSGTENLTTWSQGLKQWLTYLVPGVLPNAFGNPTWSGEYQSFLPSGNFVEQTIYVGIVGLVLAAVAVWARRRDRRVLFLAALGIAALGAALRIPPFDWINHLPVFNIASVGRFRLVYTFCMSVLVGIGAHEVLQPAPDRHQLSVVAGLLGSLAALCIPLLWVTHRYLLNLAAATSSRSVRDVLPRILQAYQWSNVMLYWPILIALAGCALFVLVRQRWVKVRAMQLLLFLLVVVDLFAFGINYHSTVREEDIFPETPALQRIMNEPGVFRVMGTHIDLMPNSNVVHGLQDIRGLDFPIHRYMELCQAMGGQDWLGYGILFTEQLQPRLLSLLNVKYVLTTSRLGPRVLQNMRLVMLDNDVKVYENLACLPRAFVVHSVRVQESADAALKALFSSDLALGSEIVLEKSPPVAFGTGNAQPRQDAQIVEYTPNRLVIEADSSGSGFLFLSDSYYPDWKARVDGVESEIYQADYAFRAVYLPPGHHTVEFSYEPSSFRLACASSLLALASVALLMLVPWAWARSRRLGKQ